MIKTQQEKNAEKKACKAELKDKSTAATLMLPILNRRSCEE
jgi:hypothetical protein